MAVHTSTTPSAGALRSRGFDATFVLGTALLGLTAAAVVLRRPDLFVPILFADLWFLGYHHVIATFTRLGADRDVRRQHDGLLKWAPLAVVAAVAAMWAVGGAWPLVTTYLYWQWFHYTRQSWGILQAYRRKAEQPSREPEWLLKAAFWGLPVWGILYRSYQDPDSFLSLPVRTLPVPHWAMVASGVVGVSLFVVVIGGRVRSALNGTGSRWETGYLAVHGAMFVVGYVLIAPINVGWLAVNIWHNAQYVLFVWHFNRNRFKEGVAPEARAISWLSQPGRAVPYFLGCLAVSTLVYSGIELTLATVIPAVVIYQVINFHHYVADSLIWKMRRPEVREAALGSP